MAKKRGRGEGSIYERNDGRWAAAIDLGFEDDRRVRKTIYGATRRQIPLM
jgi:integrase